MTRRHLIIPVLVLALAPAACGGSDEPKTTSTTAAAPAKKLPPIPEELKGKWTTTLDKADAPPGLHVFNPFSVTVSDTGGVDNGPAFTLGNSQEAIEGETSRPVVDGDTITLRGEGCFENNSVYRFYDNVYRYTISGDTLRFTVVKNACKDRHAESILTSGPFKRSAK
jgi:hypothetical protein